MIGGLKPYPAYKDSGVPWLGAVPAGWKVRRLKSLFREVDVRTQTGAETLLSLRMHRGLVDHLASGGRPISANDLVGFKLTNPGQIVMNRMRAASGLFAVTKQDGLVSPDYAVLNARHGLSLDYYVHLFKTPLMASEFRRESKGLGTGESGFLRLYTDRFGTIRVPFPPGDEQAAIVRVLGHVDRRVRRYIRAKQKLIALVEEERLAIAHNSQQPGGSRELRLQAAAEMVERPIDRQAEDVYTRIGLYNRGRGIFQKPAAKGSELGDSDFFWIKEGDFVLSGQFAWEGAIAMAGRQDDGCIASHRYPVLRGKPGVAESACLLSFFQTAWGRTLLDIHSRGAAGRNRPLNATSLMKERIHIPPMAAQRRITILVRLESDLRKELAKLVTLVREYRMRLATEVITGRVDVREAVQRLPPEDTDDSEAAGPGAEVEELGEQADEGDGQVGTVVAEADED